MRTKLLTTLALAGCTLAMWTSCDTAADLPDELPKYPVTAPISVATATSGGNTVDGTIDNDKRTITFKFDQEGADIKDITVHLEYKENVTPGKDAFTGDKTLDLTEDYTFTINNNVDDVQYTIHAEVTLATLTPVTMVSATAGDKKGNVTLDNENHLISIVFVPGTDLGAVTVSMLFDDRATPGKDAFEEKTIDLTEDYTFTVNNGIDDVVYTIHAGFNSEVLLSNELCSVTRVDGDADMVEGFDNMFMANIFDGKWMSSASAYDEVEYQHFGWTMDATETTRGNWFVFDITDPAALSAVKIWPYWPYDRNDPALFSIYAWTGGDEPETWTASNSSWKKVLSGDHSELFRSDETCANPPLDKASEFVEAKYYCFVMEKNFYSTAQEDCDTWWYVRVNWCTMSELQIWVLE